MCTFPVPTAQHTRPIVAPFVSPTGRGWCLWRDEWRTGPGETEPRRLELVAPVVAGPAALSEGVFTVAPDANIPYNVGLHLFQLGVSPDFNHPRNRRGGHFAIRIPDHTRAVQQWWTVSVALLLGTYPDPSRVVLGVSLSRKPAQSTVKVWVAEGSHAAHQQQRDDLAAFLQLPTTPPLAQLEFCPHPCIRSMLRKKHAAQRGAARGLPHPQCGAEAAAATAAALPHPSFPGPGTQYHYHHSPPADAWPTRPSSVAPVAQAQYYYHPTTLTPTSPGQSDGYYYNYSYSPVDDADPVPLVREPVCRFVLPAHSPLRKIITCDAPAYEEGGMEAAETSHQHQQQYT